MTEINPKITVYIPSHNYGSYIEKSIDSVLKQTYKNWELILINDGSSDNTQEIINLYQGHEKIKCFKTNGIGLPAVCNLALKKSTGSLIIRLDGDDYFDENILLVLEKNLAENNSAAIAFADYYLINELGQIISHEKREKFNEKNNMLDIPPHGACTLIKKSVLKEVGGYREDLGAQDGLDLWTKIRDKYDAVNINLPLFFYRRHFKNLTNNNIKILTARRTINKDIVKQKIPDYSPIIAVIPCRKHFDFIKNLWNEKLLNKTLLERDIETCLKSELVDKVVVTCDSDVVIKTLNKFNSKKLIFHLRDEKSTIRSISILPTLKKIVGKLDQNFNGITVLRYLQTPFVSTAILDEAISSLIINNSDTAFGVELIEEAVYKRSQFGLELLSNKHNTIKSDFDNLYKDSQTFLALRNTNLKRGSLKGPSVSCFEVSKEESFLVICWQPLGLFYFL